MYDLFPFITQKEENRPDIFVFNWMHVFRPDLKEGLEWADDGKMTASGSIGEESEALPVVLMVRPMFMVLMVKTVIPIKSNAMNSW